MAIPKIPYQRILEDDQNHEIYKANTVAKALGGHTTVHDTRNLLTACKRLLEIQPFVIIDTTGLGRPLLNFAAKRAAKFNLSWDESEALRQVTVTRISPLVFGRDA